LGKEKKGVGQPRRVLTEEQTIQVEALAAFLTVEQMADYFGCTKPTFYAMMERDASILLRYKKGRAKAIADVARNCVQLAMDTDNPNPAMICFFLKTQAGWKETGDFDKDKDNKIDPVKIVFTVQDASS
jgi:hypothetical protein